MIDIEKLSREAHNASSQATLNERSVIAIAEQLNRIADVLVVQEKDRQAPAGDALVDSLKVGPNE